MKNYVWLTGIVTSSIALFGANALADNIQTIESDTTGTAVTLDSAVVTAILTSPIGSYDGYTYSRYSILVNDGTGSLDIFGVLPSTYTPTLGDEISITGTYSPFDDIPEIATNATTSINLLSQGNPVPAPTVYTIPQLTATVPPPFSQMEYLVELDNVSLYTDSTGTTPVSGNFTYHANTDVYAKDSSGNLIDVFVWASSYSTAGQISDGPGGSTDTKAIPTGEVDITGFLSVSGGVDQLTPISITSVPEPATLSLYGAGALLALAFRRRKS